MSATTGALTTLTIAEARALLDRRELSSTDLTEAHLARIAAVDDRVHAFLHTMNEGA
ncbi:MAG: Asp-tRNA(Asn)/Glu-tRNA(Gln) amidotransferase GatCAB subunit A, partial [Thermomicrobia bacterium]|nr:Asp-tRNA(Asn)/Glu-tRNA(Gln) amidotransferase GatCAB subunit A [Thermomicrobia bacterium]